jgi:bifunctional DNA-binding transcriptional regulator/antitoxin component of YhaV-PrlF toxin-antitoxin module
LGGLSQMQWGERGTITLPPAFRKKLGLDQIENPLMIVEEKQGRLVMEVAAAVPVREFSTATIRQWLAEDTADDETSGHPLHRSLEAVALAGDDDRVEDGRARAGVTDAGGWKGTERTMDRWKGTGRTGGTARTLGRMDDAPALIGRASSIGPYVRWVVWVPWVHFHPSIRPN